MSSTPVFVYNTANKAIERIVTVEPKVVKMYVCGLTPYDSMHVGHARVFVFFDIVRRYFEYLGLSVRLVVNFTDVEDKIIDKAKEEFGADAQKRWREIPERYIAEFFNVCKRLFIKDAYAYPRVTEHIGDIIAFIEELIRKGHAYIAPDGSVYFDVSSIGGYGSFSSQRIEDLIAGARVEPAPGKRNPLDFALWKSWKWGEPWWNSPWSPGRPGWHIECVVMSSKYLGIPFDIHGGGQDLIFPHHENEIAIAKAYYGIDLFARYWIHVGLVMVRGEKMSKSLKNIIPVTDVLNKYDGEALRLYYAMTHYRKPMNFDLDELERASQMLSTMYYAYDVLNQVLEEGRDDIGERDEELISRVRSFVSGFEEAMNDDLNTSNAVASLMEFVRFITSEVVPKAESYSKAALTETLRKYLELTGVLGLLNKAELPRAILSLIKALVEIRARLRAMRIYDLADEIRRRLNELGVVLNDHGHKTYWSVNRRGLLLREY